MVVGGSVPHQQIPNDKRLSAAHDDHVVSKHTPAMAHVTSEGKIPVLAADTGTCSSGNVQNLQGGCTCTDYTASIWQRSARPPFSIVAFLKLRLMNLLIAQF